jgi:hypothetical protein
MVAGSRNLRSGHTKSCGCLRIEKLAARQKTHGRSNTPEYISYSGAKNRCQNPNEPAFKNYGERGIKFLFESFEQFYAELGDRPKGTSLERIDNDGHYGPGNCRWATRLQQNNNQRRNRKITAFGRTRTIAWWSRESGVPATLIYQRIFYGGWPVAQALVNRDHRLRAAPKSHASNGRFVSEAAEQKWPRHGEYKMFAAARRGMVTGGDSSR